ncbi:MAG: carbohydrate kinase family protein [Promethearchaeia archaeon]
MKNHQFDVISVGAALVDMSARVKRHPKSDDEVFVARLDLLSGGAAANTAYACAKLGLKSAFLGKIGKGDQFGKKIIADFRKVGVFLDLLKMSKNYGTGSAYVAVDSKGDRRIYAHSGAADKLSKDNIKSEEILRAKILYLSSLKNINPFIKAAKIAQRNGIPVILNPGMLIIDQGISEIKQLLEIIDILIISKREYKTLLQSEKIERDILVQKSQILFDIGIKFLIVTMGSDGAILLHKEKSKKVSPCPVNEVVDTTGAGDAFSAGFICGLISNLELIWTNLLRCIKVGNYVASLCIQHFGARNGIPDEKDIRKI